MPGDPPVNFEALAKSGGDPATGGYPYSIKSADLMANFVFATLDISDALVETTYGTGGHKKRRLKIQPGTASGQLMQWDGTKWTPLPAPPAANTLLLWTGSAWQFTPAPPATGTHVLGAVGGTLQWIATEEC